MFHCIGAIYIHSYSATAQDHDMAPFRIAILQVGVFLAASEHDGKHRILDMYTRDRSTPQPDTWYNGTDDLTAAVATRVDGILHIRFRR